MLQRLKSAILFCLISTLWEMGAPFGIHSLCFVVLFAKAFVVLGFQIPVSVTVRRLYPLTPYGYSLAARQGSFPNSLDLSYGNSDEFLDVMSAVVDDHAPLMGVRSIGVDYGLVRTGIASSAGCSPRPIGILTGPNRTSVCEQIVRICTIEQADQVIVGLPLSKSGEEEEQTFRTRAFAIELSGLVLQSIGPHCPILLWDERYTTKAAAIRMFGRSESTLPSPVDDQAACILLESFYDENGSGAEKVTLPPGEMERCKSLWLARQKKHLELLKAYEQEQDALLEAYKQEKRENRERNLEIERNSMGSKKRRKKRKKSR